MASRARPSRPDSRPRWIRPAQTAIDSSALPSASALTNQPGLRPRPDQVLPEAASLYLATGAFLARLDFVLRAAFFALPACASFTTAKSARVLPLARASRSQIGRGPRPTHSLPAASRYFATSPNLLFDLAAPFLRFGIAAREGEGAADRIAESPSSPAVRL